MEWRPTTLTVLVLLASSSGDTGWSGDCSGPLPCPSVGPDDSPPCPPDSWLDLNSTCVCLNERCAQPTCKYGARAELRRRATAVPGDCCDVFECVSAREKNCSSTACPHETPCPRDSYPLPSLRAPGDCCSMPQGCQCLPAPCPIANCSPGQSAKVVRLGNGRPGTCCPLFECEPQDADLSCVAESGLAVANGSSWWKDVCTHCKCDGGRTLCAVTRCPDMPASCSEVRKLPKECCPVCVSSMSPHGCISSQGKILQNGDSWQEEPCTTCVCVDGIKKCQAYMCEVSCVNPTYVPDECCPLCNSSSVVFVPPHCPALNNCSLKCLHGFVRDDAGCFLCQCEAEECVLECEDGYEQDSHGNKLCQCAATGPQKCPSLSGCHKNCSHGYRLDKDGCPTCRCSQCRQLSDCSKNCVHGLRTNDRGCTICKCRASAKSPVDLFPTMHNTGTSCFSSEKYGHVHDEGETWFDGCRECYCHGGVEMCNLISCPVPNCTDPVFESSRDCCPRCPGSGNDEGVKEEPRHTAMVCQSVDGVYRVEGESWQLDACTRCLCHAGRVLCETRRCPAAPCDHLLASDCCPRCPPRLRPMLHGDIGCGQGRPDGATWWDGACHSCECVAGQAQCYSQICQHAACPRPVLLKNHCCPICLEGGAPQVCMVGNVTYQEGEKWSEEPCLDCVCSKGVRSCQQLACPAHCEVRARHPDRCCPPCTGMEDPRRQGESGPLEDVAYITVISLLCCVIACLVVYMWCGCRRRRHRLQLGGTCSNPAYNGFPHHQEHSPTLPPPHYSAYHYKNVPAYESPQISRSTEKSVLAPV